MRSTAYAHPMTPSAGRARKTYIGNGALTLLAFVAVIAAVAWMVGALLAGELIRDDPSIAAGALAISAGSFEVLKIAGPLWLAVRALLEGLERTRR